MIPWIFLSTDKQLFIGNEWTRAAGDEVFETVNPADGEVLCRVSLAGAFDVDSAVNAARTAYTDTVRGMSPGKRAALMHRLAELIKRDAAIFAEIECLDNGKPYKRALADVKAAIAHLQYYAGWADKIEASQIPVNDPSVLVYTRREALGVAALIVPWNFPLVMAIWKLAPALACGNCCILKPAQQTPLSAIYLAERVREAGFPSGMVQVLTGDGETGALLSHHHDINKVSFTGSTAVGKKILAASAASNLKKSITGARGEVAQYHFWGCRHEKGARIVGLGLLFLTAVRNVRSGRGCMWRRAGLMKLPKPWLPMPAH